MILGIDVSHWDGIVNFQKAIDAGVKFVIIKAMDGKVETRYFRDNYAGARNAGLIVGAYQWLYPSSKISAGGQAREFINLLKGYPVDIVPVIDFEWTNWGGAPANPTESDLNGYCVPFEAEYGTKPMIYTSAGYWNQYGNVMNQAWKEYPLWVANYGVSYPMIPRPWDRFNFWQFSASGDAQLYGIDPNVKRAVDLDYWNGTYDELVNWCNYVPETGENNMYKYSATIVAGKEFINIRASNTIASADLGDLVNGDVARGDELVDSANGDQWLHIKETNKLGLIDGWIAVKVAGATYSVVTVNTPPEAVETITFNVTTSSGKTGTATIELK
jgi:lysozyme